MVVPSARAPKSFTLKMRGSAAEREIVIEMSDKRERPKASIRIFHPRTRDLAAVPDLHFSGPPLRHLIERLFLPGCSGGFCFAIHEQRQDMALVKIARHITGHERFVLVQRV